MTPLPVDLRRFVPRIGAHANSTEAMLGMVSAGLGIAPAPWTVLLRPPPDLAFVATPSESFDAVAVTLVADAGALVFEAARELLSAAATAR